MAGLKARTPTVVIAGLKARTTSVVAVVVQAFRPANGYIPVLPDPCLAALEDEQVTGQQFVNTAEHRFGAGDVPRAQDLRDDRSIRQRLDPAAREQRLDFGSEEEQIAGTRPIERLDAEAIAHEQQPLLRRVPERERKHAAEPVDALVAPLLVRVDDRFGVRAGLVAMTARFEIAPNLGVVVDLAVEDDPDRLVLVRQRLMAA